MNSIFTNVLLVVHVAVCLLLCLVVLMQRPKQEGLGAAFGGGMTDQAFGARTTDVLQKGTVYLGTLLFIITLILSILVGAKSRDKAIDLDNTTNATTQVDEAAAALPTDSEDKTPAVPADKKEEATEADKTETTTPETTTPESSNGERDAATGAEAPTTVPATPLTPATPAPAPTTPNNQ